MSVQQPIKRNPLPFLLLASGTAALAVVGSRLYTTRKVNHAQELIEALLQIHSLREAQQNLPHNPTKALSCCLSYLLHMVYRSVENPFVMEDPAGNSRTHRHPLGAVATVLTERLLPDAAWSFAVTMPHGGEVRGSRQVSYPKNRKLVASLALRDNLQIQLPGDYTAQLECEMSLSNKLWPGQARPAGIVVLQDNYNNVGRIRVVHDGSLMGTITRHGQIVGRVEGTMPNAFYFRQYQLTPGEDTKE